MSPSMQLFSSWGQTSFCEPVASTGKPCDVWEHQDEALVPHTNLIWNYNFLYFCQARSFLPSPDDFLLCAPSPPRVFTVWTQAAACRRLKCPLEQTEIDCRRPPVLCAFQSRMWDRVTRDCVCRLPEASTRSEDLYSKGRSCSDEGDDKCNFQCLFHPCFIETLVSRLLGWVGVASRLHSRSRQVTEWACTTFQRMQNYFLSCLSKPLKSICLKTNYWDSATISRTCLEMLNFKPVSQFACPVDMCCNWQWRDYTCTLGCKTIMAVNLSQFFPLAKVSCHNERICGSLKGFGGLMAFTLERWHTWSWKQFFDSSCWTRVFLYIQNYKLVVRSFAWCRGVCIQEET